MSTVNEHVERSLIEILGDERVSTDRVERKLYSTDIGVLPHVVSPLMPTGTAGAVVRPRTEDDVRALVALAQREHIPLVPRGMGTSGYGGVLPAPGALVMDLSGMDPVLIVDKEEQTVRASAGMIWELLQKRLNEQGLDLALYPSSLRSSTVGGWLAQGGAGFGSYENGFFANCVHSARVVLPDATVREFSGSELLNLVADAEGITGVITEVTFAVRQLEPEVHRLLAFPRADSLEGALLAIASARLPIWSVTFLNPESSRLKARLPHRHGHPYEMAEQSPEPALPDAYLVMIAYPASRDGAISAPLAAICREHGGSELEADVAEHEWEGRFAPMRLKRIGPSIIPTEVVVPVSELSSTLTEIDERVKQPFVLEGMIVDGDKAVLLGFIPHDERTFGFNLAFALALVVINTAKRHNGHAYSTGLYFRQEARDVLGEERLAALAEFRRTYDPHALMNPHKILGMSGVNTFMKLASAAEPLVRPIANAAKAPTSGTFDEREKKGIPGDVAFYAYACAQCGYCVPTCEEYSVRGWLSHSPRGKYHYLKEVLSGREQFDQAMVDKFLVCTTCEVCNTRCQVQLPVEHSWMKMRGKLIIDEGRMTFPPFEMMAASLRAERDIWAARSEKRADWMPEHIKERIDPASDVLYFAGCTASFVNTDVAKCTAELLDRAGVRFNYMGIDEACCGMPMKVAGRWDTFEEIYRHNVSEARKRGAKTIVTSCPACGLVWKELYPNLAAELGEPYEFTVKHYSEIVSDAIEAGTLEFDQPIDKRLTFHDSCHIGRAQGIYEPPRDLLRAIPGVELVEMEHNREEGYCCGSVLTLVGDTPVAPKLGKLRLDEAVAVSADAVVALCPCCQVQLRDSIDKNGMEGEIEVIDLAHTVADALGLEYEDPTDYAREMWGYFEKFIWLMKPESMADLMTALLPEMMDAMPSGMIPLMKVARSVPGGLKLMGAMMPTMMPMLMPSMMPKVMPAMFAEVSRRVGPLPEDMEALMPNLLPETMDHLLPNMLPLVIPHLVPRMLEYIKNDLR